ncbi:hypothetical protein HOBO_261 [Bacillus phage Hobo]|uniref:Uncharacterized protein n=2 Tax=Caeruleovirus BM15 TaxID=1985178 RepID=A0A0S2MV24_9CAUD|nr:radical SAM domain-containing protein [Bacillus phage BM15]ALO79669.1 hypothetical protein BM10_265 [Bacillus phage BM15]AXQ67016.1 hypothetical protein HOBO_261 [Bacillus phage Hobo]
MTNENTNTNTNEELEPIVGHLVVKGGLHSEFLNATTSAVKKYTKQGYDVETHYQMVLDPNNGELVHSAYIVGKLKETKPEPLIDSFEIKRLEEWVENEYIMGEMPNGAYNTIQALLEQNKQI